jgi:hypothetical protein
MNRWLVLGCALLFAAGCGGSDGLPGPTGTVTGKLTSNGKPAPKGTTITCTHIEKSFPAVGKTDENGNFTLEMKGGRNILVGKYTVSIHPPVVNMDPAEAMRKSQAGTLPQMNFPEIPEKYRNPETSGETLDVKQGANTLNIDMKE